MPNDETKLVSPIVAVVCGLLLASTGRGHDLWLIPPDAATVGKPVLIRAHSGMDFPKSTHAPDVAAFTRRSVLGPDGNSIELAPAGKEANSGLLQFNPGTEGIHVICVETAPKLITLEADAFNEYLVSDGLAHIYRMRTKEKILNQPGRERYSKSPKMLMRLGDSNKGDPCQVAGLPLEIVPMQDPFATETGSALRVRVLFRGKPLSDANLGWQHPGDSDTPRGAVRTDERGEALVPIARSGLMTIRFTHMTRPKTADYEWESFWTSLTFLIPAAK